jgi:hypothetical protein
MQLRSQEKYSPSAAPLGLLARGTFERRKRAQELSSAVPVLVVRAGCKGKVAPCQGTLVRSRWEGGTFDAHVCHLDVGPPART